MSTSFARDRGTPEPQFIPGAGFESQPLGDREAQVAEAMALAKELNRQPEEGMEVRIAAMAAKNVSTACDFLDGLSQHEREKYLAAEKAGKSRVGVLGRYGW